MSWTETATPSLEVPDPVASASATLTGGTPPVSWDAATGADTYHVTYSGNGGRSWSLAELEYSGSALTNSGADSQKICLVGVGAKNVGGASSWVASRDCTAWTCTTRTGTDGPDDLTGGSGADRFVFSPDKPGHKIITDFSNGEGDKTVLGGGRLLVAAGGRHRGRRGGARNPLHHLHPVRRADDGDGRAAAG